jgi:hypothetical protein
MLYLIPLLFFSKRTHVQHSGLLRRPKLCNVDDDLTSPCCQLQQDDQFLSATCNTLLLD